MKPLVEKSEKKEVVQTLFLKEGNRLRGFIMGFVPDFNQADDIFQEVFLTVSMKADDFQEGSNFSAWVRAIARIKILEHTRKAKQPLLIADKRVLESLMVTAEEVEESWMQRRNALSKCLKKLSPRVRNIMSLRYGKELPTSQVAKKISWSVGAVQVALSRARLALRKCTERLLVKP